MIEATLRVDYVKKSFIKSKVHFNESLFELFVSLILRQQVSEFFEGRVL